MNIIKEFFTTDRVPRWQIVVFGLFVIGVGWLQSDYYHNKSIENSLDNAQVARLEAELLGIKSRSVDFQTYAGAFVSSILDNTDSQAESRAALVQNILAQDAAVDVTTIALDPQTQKAIEDYRSALREMKIAVDLTTDVVSMTQFWEAASNLLVTRDTLLTQLQNQINPPTS